MKLPIKNTNKNKSYFKYENFFNMYQDNDGFLFYNILKNINILPAKETSIEDDYITLPRDTWINIAYKYYDDVDLWWLVCEYNQIKEPLKIPEPGTKLKLLKPEFVVPVLNELNRQIKR
jgi:hypothetical protein